jgi:DNA-binding CsgD family transcriptional regulator
MSNYRLDLPQYIYAKHLTRINGIKFTPREVDIISFMCSGRSGKKTASFFSLSPKTIENHNRNIMGKLECNSREDVIDFLEKSGKSSIIKKYYLQLLVQSEFEKTLRKIALLKPKNLPAYSLVYRCPQKTAVPLVSLLANHLKMVGLSLSIQVREKIPTRMEFLSEVAHNTNAIYLISSLTFEESPAHGSFCQDFTLPEKLILFNKAFLILLDEGDIDHFPKEILDYPHQELSSQENYYCFVFDLLEQLFLPSPALDAIFANFKKREEILTNFSSQVSFPHEHKIYRQDKSKGFFQNHTHLAVLSVLVVTVIA